MGTCFTTQTSGQSFYNTGALVVPLSRVTPPKFTDVSKQLLQVCVNGVLQPPFSNSLFNYFWNYTNTGLHLGQLRFYSIETIVAGEAVRPQPTLFSRPYILLLIGDSVLILPS